MSQARTLAQIHSMIKEQATLTLGVWPERLNMLIFSTKSGWHCGLSPAADVHEAQYRDGVLEIAKTLQKTISVR